MQVQVFSLERLREFVESQRCSWCGGRLKMKYYDHPNGVETEVGKVWVYGECQKCGYQWALWKLLRRKSRSVT
ncbi:hypothetical protein DRJ17_04565 [Candidatus Woesearchaeota archaeon]|nr:MAG: hypothetical protein DRJ17_04565 [Candidatus Woesearchaeota archaeon]